MRGKGAYNAMELDRLADEMQTPAEYVMDSAHEGTEPWERSFFRVSPGTVAVTAIKRAEQGEGIIIRLREGAGKATEASVESPVLGLNFKSQIKPWEIKTLMVERARGQRAEIREVSLLER